VSRAIASLGCGPQRALLNLSSRTLIPYAQRHGYALDLHTAAAENSRPPAWSKITILRRLVQEHDLVVWIDADAMIVDGRRDIGDELADDRLMALVTHRVGQVSMPNTGVWVLRGGEEAVDLLDQIWEQDDLIHHQWWENAALCRLLGYDLDPVRLARPTDLLANRTQDLDPCWNSIYGAKAPSARINHYPGFALRTRRVLMARDLAVVRARRLARRW
jgi:hypothetical protein